MPARVAVPVTVEDYRHLAARRLPRFLFDYIDGGANAEETMAANRSRLAAIKLRQRVMCDVGAIDTSSTLAGERVAFPLALAPIGMAGLNARRGEVQAVRAANAAGIPFTLSTVGVCPPAEVAAAARAPFWFQLYMMRDRGLVRELLARASDAGCRTLVFTVDLPLAGMRHRDTRHGMLGTSFATRWAKLTQIAGRPHWIWDVGVNGKPHSLGSLSDRVADPTDMGSLRRYVDAQFDPTVTWRDIEWLRGCWDGKLLVKGVMEVEDAEAAVAAGTDGLVVSNHGGRQLDGVAATIDKLPPIVAAVGSRTEVFVDGGVRNGIDVFRALALGAHGVMIGRPWVWALAAGGEAAVLALIRTLAEELRVAMALTGVTRIDQIGRHAVEA